MWYGMIVLLLDILYIILYVMLLDICIMYICLYIVKKNVRILFSRFRPLQRQTQQGLGQLVEQHGPEQLDAPESHLKDRDRRRPTSQRPANSCSARVRASLKDLPLSLSESGSNALIHELQDAAPDLGSNWSNCQMSLASWEIRSSTRKDISSLHASACVKASHLSNPL